MDVSKNRGWFIIVPNPIKMDDLGVPLFLETPIYAYIEQELHPTFIHYMRAQGFRDAKIFPPAFCRGKKPYKDPLT